MPEFTAVPTGPMFDGRASATLKAYELEMRYRIAEKGKEMVLETLHEVLQNPTGYYESQVRVEGRANYVDVVTDGGVIYGPWLEGTSSRNQTTRFKGYGTFRKVRDKLNSEAVGLALRFLPEYVRRMN